MSFIGLIKRKGAVVLYHRDDSMVPCPCRSPEGFRNPEWHLDHFDAVECNEEGYLTGQPIELNVKAFIQSAFTGRRTVNTLTQFFGEIQIDDYIGLFPPEWDSVDLNFENWGRAGEDYVMFAGKRFMSVGYITVPDPWNNNKIHHHEVALRRINQEIV